MGLNPYKAVNGYTVVYDHWTIKIITKEKLDVMEWIIFLPKTLIQFILEFDLASPLKATVLSLNEEVWCNIDAICFSPDEKRGFLTLKNLYYMTK
jgi:hypothetical protein